MKQVIAVFVVSVYALPGQQCSGADQAQSVAGPIDLILVAGQSNAVGFDTKPAELPADAADQQIMFWWRCGDPPPDDHDSICGGKWTHLRPQPRGNPSQDKTYAGGRQYGNFRFPEGGFGPEMGLARTLHAKQGKRLAIVKAAFSGTSMTHDWTTTNAGSGGECYHALVAEIRAAIAAAKQQGIALRPRAFVWVQGESDANAQAASRYEKALGDMLAALRRDLAAPEMLALIGVNTRFGGVDKVTQMVQAIIDAQKSLAAKDSRCAYVDTDGATLANVAHFDSAGTLDVGRRFAEALLKLEAERMKRTQAKGG